MGEYHDYDRAQRGGAGAIAERKQLEVAGGKELSAHQIYVTPHRPPRPRSPELPPARAQYGAGAGASSSSGGFGCFGDPEMKRRRRVASYKAYAVEGRFKASIRRGIRWIKGKCSELVHGW